MTWRPRPLPSFAPSIIPGKSKICSQCCELICTDFRVRSSKLGHKSWFADWRETYMTG
jgi:hypothetical protein